MFCCKPVIIRYRFVINGERNDKRCFKVIFGAYYWVSTVLRRFFTKYLNDICFQHSANSPLLAEHNGEVNVLGRGFNFECALRSSGPSASDNMDNMCSKLPCDKGHFAACRANLLIIGFVVSELTSSFAITHLPASATAHCSA